MFYNNLISIPILIVASFAFEDWGAANLAQNLYTSLCEFTDVLAQRTIEIVFYSPFLCLDSHLSSSVTAQHGVYASPLQQLTGIPTIFLINLVVWQVLSINSL
jgi:hypothetical protein